MPRSILDEAHIHQVIRETIAILNADIVVSANAAAIRSCAAVKRWSFVASFGHWLTAFWTRTRSRRSSVRPAARASPERKFG